MSDPVFIVRTLVSEGDQWINVPELSYALRTMADVEESNEYRLVAKMLDSLTDDLDSGGSDGP